MDETVASRYAELESLVAEISECLLGEVEKLGFSTEEVMLQPPGDAVYRLQRDPADGSYSLVGEWRDQQGIKQGELLFHADGSFYVEQDVARPHPRRSRWFVEAVNAWGKDGKLKVESRLLPLPE